MNFSSTTCCKNLSLRRSCEILNLYVDCLLIKKLVFEWPLVCFQQYLNFCFAKKIFWDLYFLLFWLQPWLLLQLQLWLEILFLKSLNQGQVFYYAKTCMNFTLAKLQKIVLFSFIFIEESPKVTGIKRSLV